MKKIFCVLALLILSINHTFAADVIWRPENVWSEKWEQEYAKWVKKEVGQDFFIKHNIPTDCADAVIGLRWIFARQMSLPAANRLEGTDQLFGHFSIKDNWKKLPTAVKWNEDKLFLTALRYVMNMTSTRTVDNDGYPVKLNRAGLHAGTYIVTKSDFSGHIRIITDTNFESESILPFYTRSSTSPAYLRKLNREVFLDDAWPVEFNKEILSFRWPVKSNGRWNLALPESHPLYSLEQFDRTLPNKHPSFIKFLINRVKKNFNPSKVIEAGIKDLTNSIELRKVIVTEGYKFCQQNDCHEGSKGFDDWSTQERDGKFVDKIKNYYNLIKQYDNSIQHLTKKWTKSMALTKVVVLKKDVTLQMIIEAFLQNKTSSYPLDTPFMRWGFIIL